jgi:predicted acylesterase/phospholipase RssA
MSGATNNEWVAKAPHTDNLHVGSGQIVLVFHGGGALGAYRAGVYQALRPPGLPARNSPVRVSNPRHHLQLGAGWPI